MNPGWAGRAARKEAVCGTLRDSLVGTPPGKLHPEQGALRACFSPDLAPVSGHDGRDDREAEPGATRGTVARLVYPIEPFEHALRLLFAQAGTFVFDWNAPGLTEAPFLGFSRILEEGVRAP